MNCLRRVLWWGLCGIFWVSLSNAAVASASNLMDSVSKTMISELQNHKATLKSNPSIVYEIVHRVLLPHVDMETMSRSVLGRNAWGGASSNQRQQFKEEFTHLIIQTYATALAQYNDEEVQFYPVRGDESSNRVQVDSVIVRKAGNSIPVSYRLIRNDSDWKIYDMSVEGVSLIQSFRSQFSADLQKGGLDQLLQNMSKHNAGRS